MGVEGKRVIQLCCNNAAETVSLCNMGAAHCVGVDAAEEFLEQGREFIEVAGVGDRIDLIRSDVYDLPTELNASFDIALVTVGVLSWMPDLPGFFAAANQLLKPGGCLIIEDMHPVLFMYEEDANGGPSFIKYSYFTDEVWEETNGLDYFGKADYESNPHYSFMHRLDAILMAGIRCDLVLRSFKELDYDISLFCSDLEKSETKPPLGFVMVMESTAKQ
ncbi:MAG: class I SAM-dependent methyltransferase [Pseudomonadota bacterium]